LLAGGIYFLQGLLFLLDLRAAIGSFSTAGLGVKAIFATKMIGFENCSMSIQNDFLLQEIFLIYNAFQQKHLRPQPSDFEALSHGLKGDIIRDVRL
jgi:hypothetical protein